MATLICVKSEKHPHCKCAAGKWAYFDGTPTRNDFKYVMREEGLDAAFAASGSRWPKDWKPEQIQDEVADRAGLQRWFLFDDC